jgi:hypothetical protein
LISLEKTFMEKLNQKKGELLPIFRESRYSLKTQTHAITRLISMAHSAQIIESAKQIKVLGNSGKILQSISTIKYTLFVFLAILSILFGILSCFIGKNIVFGNSVTFNSILIGIHLFVLTLILLSQVIANFLEGRFMINQKSFWWYWPPNTEKGAI